MIFTCFFATFLLPVVYMVTIGVPASDRYYVGNEEVNRDSAVAMCTSKSMKLVSIQTSQKNQNIFEVLQKKGEFNKAFWTSGKQSENGEFWQWLNGEKIDYFNWGAGEPNGVKGARSCMEVYAKDSDVKWNDQPCGDLRPYICEMSISVSVRIKEFQLSNDTATAAQALQRCKDKNMQLASILTKEENDDLYKQVQERGGVGPMWTSGRRKPNGIWQWLTGMPFTFYQWRKGEPNAPKTSEVCLEVFPNGGTIQWNDHYCSQKRYYVCEKFKLSVGVGQ